MGPLTVVPPAPPSRHFWTKGCLHGGFLRCFSREAGTFSCQKLHNGTSILRFTPKLRCENNSSCNKGSPDNNFSRFGGFVLLDLGRSSGPVPLTVVPPAPPSRHFWTKGCLHGGFLWCLFREAGTSSCQKLHNGTSIKRFTPKLRRENNSSCNKGSSDNNFSRFGGFVPLDLGRSSGPVPLTVVPPAPPSRHFWTKGCLHGGFLWCF